MSFRFSIPLFGLIWIAGTVLTWLYGPLGVPVLLFGGALFMRLAYMKGEHDYRYEMERLNLNWQRREFP